MLLSGVRESLRRSPALRAGTAVAAFLLIAEGAYILLSPSVPGAGPVGVRIEDFLPGGEIARSVEYRDGQRLLFVFGLSAQALAVGALVAGRPRSLRRVLDRLGGRPLLGAAAAGALVVVIATLAAGPTLLWSHERAADVGLSTQSASAWLSDQGRSLAITVVIAAAGAAALSALIRRYPRSWWLPGSLAVVAYGVAVSFVAPVVVAPLFNDFDELAPSSAIRERVQTLADRGGVDIDAVYRVDASKRSTALNAYVAGIGPTKRVVLYDTLIDGGTADELDAVVAHELGHAAHDDIPRGILFVALIAPLGLIGVRELMALMSHRSRAVPGTAAAVPGLFLAIAILSFGAGIPANQLSRQVEVAADRFALEVTDDPRALISLQVRLATSNLSDPSPPAIAQVLFGTHPTTVERIGAALAYEREP